MLKKFITYKDYNGNERKDPFYFNLSRAELIEMQMTTEGGMDGFLQSIIETKDNRKLFNLFKDMIRMSYGVKSDDGKRFIKSPELSAAFMQSEAYTELLLELMGDNAAQAVADFVKGIMPLDGLSDEEINKAMAEASTKIEESYPDAGTTMLQFTK